MKATIALAAASVLVFSGQLAAQVAKCSDAAGEITYSSKPCNLIGLRDVGPIGDRVTVVHEPPVVVRPAPAREVRPRPAPAPAVAAAPPAAPAAGAPPVPERRCFTVKTATGTAVRCNDRPADE